MIYTLLKYITKGMIRIYFGKVYVRGMDQVPVDKPLILAANHQSAFIEPCILGAILPFDVHFITRGDVFTRSFLWFFKATNQIPIFRFQDGYSRMKENIDSFSRVYEELNDGARVIIFCEGSMKWIKRLRPVQLGPARMAIGAYKLNPDLDIHIVPVGISYEDHLTMRRYVKISFAEAIPLRDYIDDLEQNERQALVRVTKELSRRLRPEVIHISSENHYDLANDYLAMRDNEWPRHLLPLISDSATSIQASINAARETAHLDHDDDLRRELEAYRKRLGSSFTYKDYILAHPESFGLPDKILFWLIIAPLGLIGIVCHGLPLVLADIITKKTTSVPEFNASVRSNLGGFLYLIYFFLVLSISWTIFGAVIMLWLLLFLIVTGVVALYFWDWRRYYLADLQVGSCAAEDIQDLRRSRHHIIQSMTH